MSVDGMQLHSLRTAVGTRLASNPLDSRWSLTFDSVWLHELLTPTTDYTAAFSNARFSSFSGRGLNVGRDWLSIGPGIGYQHEGLRVFADYQAMLNTNQVIHAGTGGVELAW